MYNYKFPYSILILLFYFVSVSLIKILGVFAHNSYYEQLLISSIIVYFCFVIPITFFVKYLQNQNGHKYTFLQFKVSPQQILLVLISLFLVFSIQFSTKFTLDCFTYIGDKYNLEVINNLIVNAKENQSQNLEIITNNNLFANIVFISLMPAVIEELFFRGFIFFELRNNYKNNNINNNNNYNFDIENQNIPQINKYFILVSSFLFAFMHFDFLFFIQYFMISVVLSYSYIKSNNILVPTIIHFLNNLIVILIKYNF